MLLGLMAVLSAVIGVLRRTAHPVVEHGDSGRVVVDLRRGSADQRSGHACEASQARIARFATAATSRQCSSASRIFAKGGADSESASRQGRQICEAWCLMGSHPDHYADLCFEATGSADRTYDRPFRSGCGLLTEPGGAGDSRRSGGGVRRRERGRRWRNAQVRLGLTVVKSRC